MNKISNFLKMVTSRIKGDEAGVIASKNERKANSAFKGQIAALEARKVDDENAVEESQEAYNDALYPTSLIKDNSLYVKGVVSAKDRLDNAKEVLAATEASLKFFKDLVESEWKEVDA